MSLIGRLRLDEIVTSFPELGPTVPDGGYSWVVLSGVVLVQMTVPSILAMYGTVLAYIHETNSTDFALASEKFILTPILFVAFWNLSDPWTKTIVSIASVPRLVGIVGVILLAVGTIASGYLATGGVGAYLASTSAGAVMGIGASFVVLLSDYVLRKYFRDKLLLALTVRNVAISFGLVLVPSVTNLLLHKARLKSGLQLMTVILVPTGLGTLSFALPPRQHASPYSLLLSTEDDTELPIRIASDVRSTGQDETENSEYGRSEERIQHGGGLVNEGSNIYAYEEPDEDVDLFVNPVARSSSKWKHQLRAFKNCRFWFAAVGWIGMKLSAVYFWILLPAFGSKIVHDSSIYMSILLTAGSVTFLPSLISYKMLKATSQSRRLYFGVASWICGTSLIGLIYATSYEWMLICALAGGIGVGSLSSCQDLALYDILGAETVRSAHKGLSTIVGACVLIFSFVHDTTVCLSVTALLQFLGGLYWIASPVLNCIESTRHRSFRTMNNRTNSDET